MKIIYEIYSHSGTRLEKFEINSDIIPRAGEIIVLDEMDNTTEFIVTDILHYPKDGYVEIKCESFYRQGGYTRADLLRLSQWLPSDADMLVYKAKVADE